MRPRDKNKELAHSSFRMKDISTIDRLNRLYEDDLHILDCEMVESNRLRKKRISLPEAENIFNKKRIAEIEKLRATPNS